MEIPQPTTQSTRHARGTFKPVVYFENGRGVIALPHSTEESLRIKDQLSRKGFELREAGSIQAVQDLQRRMQKQEEDLREGRLEHEKHMFERVNAERKARLIQRRNSSWCPPFERDAIDAHLINMEKRRSDREAKERQVHHYFEALEFNSNSHHLMDAVEAVPDMSDEQCIKCYNYRRIKGLMICARCASEVTQHHA